LAYLDVLEVILHVSPEVWVLELPGMLAVAAHSILGVLDLVEVILVKLPYERREV